MNHLFNHKKKYKHIGFVIIVVMVVLMILSHVKVQSVSEHKAQQQNMANEYNLNSEKQSSTIITSKAVEEVTDSMNGQDDSSFEDSKQLNNDDHNSNVNIGSNDNNGHNASAGQNNFTTNEESDNAFINNNQEFADDSSKTGDPQIENDKKYITCSIEITCEALRNHMDQWSNQAKDKDAVVPQDYTYLKSVNITVAEGSSVYDVLMKAAAQYGITVFTKPGSDYIISINQLAEKDVGRSGWMYKINGDPPGTGCSTCLVNDNDVILWYYVI